MLRAVLFGVPSFGAMVLLYCLLWCNGLWYDGVVWFSDIDSWLVVPINSYWCCSGEVGYLCLGPTNECWMLGLLCLLGGGWCGLIGIIMIFSCVVLVVLVVATGGFGYYGY